MLAALALVTGCRLHFDYAQRGSPWAPASYESLTPKTHDRGDALRLLGPPDVVHYTLSREVFLYRVGGHRGSTLEFFFPIQAIPGLALIDAARETVRTLFGAKPDEGEFAPDLGTRVASSLVLGFLNLAPSDFATPDPFELRGQRLRYDIIRLVFDRRTRVLLGKEELLGIEVGRSEDLIDTALLVK